MRTNTQWGYAPPSTLRTLLVGNNNTSKHSLQCLNVYKYYHTDMKSNYVDMWTTALLRLYSTAQCRHIFWVPFSSVMVYLHFINIYGISHLGQTTQSFGMLLWLRLIYFVAKLILSANTLSSSNSLRTFCSPIPSFSSPK